MKQKWKEALLYSDFHMRLNVKATDHTMSETYHLIAVWWRVAWLFSYFDPAVSQLLILVLYLWKRIFADSFLVDLFVW